jgi:hypothetical protein
VTNYRNAEFTYGLIAQRNQKLPKGADRRGHRRAKRWRARSAPSAAAATRHRQPYVQVDGGRGTMHNGLVTGIANDSVDRLWLRPGLARCLREPRDNLPQRKGEALCRAACRRPRSRVVPAGGRGKSRRWRPFSQQFGKSRAVSVPRSLARLCSQGGPARASRRQLDRGLPDRNGYFLPLLRADGKAGRAADDP